MTTSSFGQYGEDLACRYLKKLDYKIIERNFRIRGGEIDIIALDGETLVYVEVKTRSTYRFGRPEEQITPWKIKFLERAAKFYRVKRKNLPASERIDVLTIDLTLPEKLKFNLIKNAGF